MTHNAYNDPYARRATASKKRVKFEKIKRTQTFKQWRSRQLKVQNNSCAYCRVNLDKRGIVTHIDHVTPLYYDGNNEYNNFVLSCRRCNMRKWISNRYVVPQWIKDNDEKMRQEQRLKSFRNAQKQQAREIIDEQILEDLRWIFEE